MTTRSEIRRPGRQPAECRGCSENGPPPRDAALNLAALAPPALRGPAIHGLPVRDLATVADAGHAAFDGRRPSCTPGERRRPVRPFSAPHCVSPIPRSLRICAAPAACVAAILLMAGAARSGESVPALSDEQIADYEVGLPDMAPKDREPIVRKILAAHDKRTAGLLMSLLLTGADSPELQESMCRLLEDIASPELYEEAVELLKRDDERSQEIGARIIARTRHNEAAAKLIELYRLQTRLVSRKLIVRCLGETQSKQAREFLRTLPANEILGDSQADELYEEWVLARVKLADPEAIQPLLELHTQNSTKLVGEYAAHRWNRAKMTPVAIRRLELNIARREELSHRIGDLLQHLPSGVIPAFIELCGKVSDPETATVVVENISPLITRETAPQFIGFLKHPLLQVREVVCERLFEVGDTALVERLGTELRKSAEGTDLNDRLLAMRMAFLLPREKATDILRRGLEDTSRWVRIEAIRNAPLANLGVLQPDLEALRSVARDERELWDIAASLAGVRQ